MTSFGRAMLAEWDLDPAVTYLNHGTVGATPRRVVEEAHQIRLEIERRPSQFLLRELSAIAVGGPRDQLPRLRDAADRVARFLGAAGKDLVFVDNATTGINAVLRSTSFTTGDTILVTDHAYGAIRHAAAFRARETGATLATVTLPGPPYRPEAIVDAIAEALTPSCRLAIVEQVTAMSALILPIGTIAALCRERGIPLLVDGAHVPGAIALDIGSIGADWYAANLHKWGYAPRSSGFLWAAPARQDELHPPVISWGLDRGFTTEFDWTGTRDPAPHLAAPSGLELLESWNAAAVRDYNHRLAWQAGAILAKSWGTEVSSEEAMVGTMITLPLPARLGDSIESAASVRDRLLFGHAIEVQIHPWRGSLWARVSAQVYNDEDDVRRFARAIETIR